MRHKKYFLAGALVVGLLVAFWGVQEAQKNRNEDVDLQHGGYFLKQGEPFSVGKLTPEQRHELRCLFDQYDLRREGESFVYTSMPFSGTIAEFRVKIEGKPYLLLMMNKSTHTFKPDSPHYSKMKRKWFWLNPLDSKGELVGGDRFYEEYEPIEWRFFESARLYDQLEAFLEKHATPFIKKSTSSNKELRKE